MPNPASERIYPNYYYEAKCSRCGKMNLRGLGVLLCPDCLTQMVAEQLKQLKEDKIERECPSPFAVRVGAILFDSRKNQIHFDTGTVIECEGGVGINENKETLLIDDAQLSPHERMDLASAMVRLWKDYLYKNRDEEDDAWL